MPDRKERQSAELELPAIINKPQLQPRWQRSLFAVAATFAWFLWFYLLMPVFTMVGWLFNLHLFGRTLTGEQVQHWHLFVIYGLIIWALGLVLIIWALYNYLRFKGVDRRRPLPPLRDEKLGQLFDLQHEQVGRMHKAQIVHLWHNESGDITHVEIDKLLPPDTE